MNTSESDSRKQYDHKRGISLNHGCRSYPPSFQQNQCCDINHVPTTPLKLHPVQIISHKRVTIASQNVIRSVLIFLCTLSQCRIPRA
ncbi:hypothetical protein Hanom_Chr17g01577271 [Helianthus anomalus]